MASLAASLLLGCNVELPADPISADDAPRVLAEQICDQIYECGCEQQMMAFANEAECVALKQADIEDALNEAASEGRSWSPQCAGELAKIWTKWGCLGPVAARAEARYIARACELTHGEKAVGEQCYHNDFGDECSPGLACVDGACIESPTFPVPTIPPTSFATAGPCPRRAKTAATPATAGPIPTA